MRYNRLITVVCVFLLRLSQIFTIIFIGIMTIGVLFFEFKSPLALRLGDNYVIEALSSESGLIEVSYAGQEYGSVGVKPTGFMLDFESVPIPDWIMTIPMFLLGVILYYLLHLLIRLLKSIEEREFFSLQNVKRLRTIGFMAIGYSILKWLYGYISHYILVDYLDAKGVYRIDNGFTLNFGFFSTAMFLGLMILLVANAFEHGLRLQQEQELTI